MVRFRGHMLDILLGVQEGNFLAAQPPRVQMLIHLFALCPHMCRWFKMHILIANVQSPPFTASDSLFSSFYIEFLEQFTPICNLFRFAKTHRLPAKFCVAQ